MNHRTLFFSLSVLVICFACEPAENAGTTETTSLENNPPAEGFNAAASDERAIAIADSVMKAMGGRRAWDNTRYIGWNFFGARELLWDKKSGLVRIQMPSDSTVFLINVKTDTGRVMLDGKRLENQDSLAKYVQRGESIWINDSYWLLMPFKLKDSGVTLKYQGQDTIQGGQAAQVLQLTFDGVGDTPQNKYRVFVDQDDHLVKQWQFYRDAADEEPAFTTPWKDYQKHGDILLSGDRGQRQITNIHVYESVPDRVFHSFEPVDLDALAAN